ncbi:General alpha-glucoside permease like protein [Verticillium longisporum]|uniref:General alpha-glucoside permease like protein n=1 Tax=Verticillium longisporum TaxID=100787 RepID=A0A8I2ZRY0_VERLO|nr:General alpha-glucoside permease like protein [Verticillium longisporum]
MKSYTEPDHRIFRVSDVSKSSLTRRSYAEQPTLTAPRPPPQCPPRSHRPSAVSRIETTLALREALRYYRKAIAWSLAVSTATIMESYDLMLIGSFFAFPPFQRKFGVQLPNGSWSIPARWQLALGMVTNCGLILGVFANGYCAARWGFRKVLTAGTFLMSIPCGFFAAAAPSYAAEITPLKLSGYATVYVNLCWVMGKLIAFGVLAGLLSNPTEWAYRLPFALQWVAPVPLLAATYFAPESPWWLVRKGRNDEAEVVVRRLLSAPEEVINPRDTVAMMARTIRTEKEMSIHGSWADCFRGDNLRRTEISMISWGCQILPGFAVQNYITCFFTLTGLSPADSFYMSIGNASLAFVGTVTSFFLMTKLGWRTVYLAGLAAMLPLMSLVGFLALAPANPAIRWAQSALLLIWFLVYGLSIGPIPYGIAAAVGATNLRVKTISLGRNIYYILNIANTVVAPYLLNPQEANLQGKAAFPAAGLTLMLAVWAWFRLPELKRLTGETLDSLFERKVPARQFLKAAKELQHVR